MWIRWDVGKIPTPLAPGSSVPLKRITPGYHSLPDFPVPGTVASGTGLLRADETGSVAGAEVAYGMVMMLGFPGLLTQWM